MALALAATIASSDVSQAGPYVGHVTSRDLATLRDVTSLSVSPDGLWAAFAVVQGDPDRNTYTLTWTIVPTSVREGPAATIAPGGSLGPFSEGLTSLEFQSYGPPPPPVWSSDSEWITFLRWEGDRAQIWRSRRDGLTEQLTTGEEHVRRFSYARDGNSILYDTEPSLAQINRALFDEGRTGFLFDNRFHPAYDRLPLSVNSSGAVEEPRVLAYDLIHRRQRLATSREREEFQAVLSTPRPQGSQRQIGKVATSSGGATAWFDAIDPQQQGVRPPTTIVVSRRAGQRALACSVEQCSNQRLAGLWWRNEDELIFLRHEGPQGLHTGIYSLSVTDGSVRTILHTQSKLLNHWSSTGDAHSSCAIGGDRLVCFHEDLTAPRRVVAIDLNEGSIETLYNPNPHFSRFELGRVDRIEFASPSGETYHGVLALPPNRRANERLPLVILTYRCDGFLRGGVGDEYPAFPLTSEGFAVLCLNVPDGQEQLATLDLVAFQRWFWREGAGQRLFLDSLQAAVAFLDSEAIIDPDRVGITGLSRGAQLVGWAMSGMPRLAAASASGTPGTSGPSAYFLEPDYARQSSESVLGLGNPNDSLDQWRALSFSSQVERVRTPLLINAADREMMYALEPVVTLRDAGRAVDMYVYPDEYHWKWQPAHRLAIYDRNIDWMNFWLRGAEDRDPEKAAQYVRWRLMRDGLQSLQSPAPFSGALGSR